MSCHSYNAGGLLDQSGTEQQHLQDEPRNTTNTGPGPTTAGSASQATQPENVLFALSVCLFSYLLQQIDAGVEEAGPHAGTVQVVYDVQVA